MVGTTEFIYKNSQIISSNTTLEKTTLYDNDEQSVATQILFAIFIIFTCVIGIVGNLITFVIVYRKSAMRSAINLLLTNMAMTDLIFVVTLGPYVMAKLFRRKITNQLFMCVCFSFIKDTLMCVNSYTLLVISFDRFFIIVRRKDGLCPKGAKRFIAIIWCCSIAFATPQFVSFDGEHKWLDQLMCDFAVFSIGYSGLLVAIIFYIPIAAMLYTYGAILRSVQRSFKRIHNHPGRPVSVSVTQYSCKLGLPTVSMPNRFTGGFNTKRRAFKTILIMFVTLLVCWLPYMVYRIVEPKPSARASDYIAIMTLLYLGLLKSAIYPVIYCLRNKKFRLACQRMIPTSFNCPENCCNIKHGRVNPSYKYEYTMQDTSM